MLHPIKHKPKLYVGAASVVDFDLFHFVLLLIIVFFFMFLFIFFFNRDLSNNHISELASDAFQGLRSLNSL